MNREARVKRVSSSYNTINVISTRAQLIRGQFLKTHFKICKHILLIDSDYYDSVMTVRLVYKYGHCQERNISVE